MSEEDRKAKAAARQAKLLAKSEARLARITGAGKEEGRVANDGGSSCSRTLLSGRSTRCFWAAQQALGSLLCHRALRTQLQAQAKRAQARPRRLHCLRRPRHSRLTTTQQKLILRSRLVQAMSRLVYQQQQEQEQRRRALRRCS